MKTSREKVQEIPHRKLWSLKVSAETDELVERLRVKYRIDTERDITRTYIVELAIKNLAEQVFSKRKAGR